MRCEDWVVRFDLKIDMDVTQTHVVLTEYPTSSPNSGTSTAGTLVSSSISNLQED
jgi:hypothetical protein